MPSLKSEIGKQLAEKTAKNAREGLYNQPSQRGPKVFIDQRGAGFDDMMRYYGNSGEMSSYLENVFGIKDPNKILSYLEPAYEKTPEYRKEQYLLSTLTNLDKQFGGSMHKLMGGIGAGGLRTGKQENLLDNLLGQYGRAKTGQHRNIERYRQQWLSNVYGSILDLVSGGIDVSDDPPGGRWRPPKVKGVSTG